MGASCVLPSVASLTGRSVVSARFQWVFEESWSTTGTSSCTVQQNKSWDWQSMSPSTNKQNKHKKHFCLYIWLSDLHHLLIKLHLKRGGTFKKVAVDTFYLYHDEWFLFASFPISPKWMEVCGILTKASNTKQIGPQCVLQFFQVSIKYSYPRNFTI